MSLFSRKTLERNPDGATLAIQIENKNELATADQNFLECLGK